MSKRRGSNEGSIYRRADGLWVASLNLGTVNGKRRRRVVYGHTRREVAEKLQRLQQEQGLGVDLAADRQTVEQFLQSWLQQIVKKYRSEKTYANYEYIVRVRIVPHIGHLQLDRLTSQRIQSLINNVAEELHPNSVRYVRTVLSVALNQAVVWGLLPRNPAEHVSVPKAKKPDHYAMTEEEAGRFLAVVRGHRLEVLYRIALSLGVRLGEIRRLEWSDIEGNRLHIREGKTPAAARVLSLSPVLQSALETHRSFQALEKQAQGDKWEEQGYVFPSERGRLLNDGTVRAHFKRSLQRAGLPGHIRFHDLRHSAASFLLAQREHPRVIMQILGHSSIRISMDTYAHPTDDSVDDALSKLADRLQSGYNEAGECSK